MIFWLPSQSTTKRNMNKRRKVIWFCLMRFGAKSYKHTFLSWNCTQRGTINILFQFFFSFPFWILIYGATVIWVNFHGSKHNTHFHLNTRSWFCCLCCGKFTFYRVGLRTLYTLHTYYIYNQASLDASKRPDSWFSRKKQLLNACDSRDLWIRLQVTWSANFLLPHLPPVHPWTIAEGGAGSVDYSHHISTCCQTM